MRLRCWPFCRRLKLHAYILCAQVVVGFDIHVALPYCYNLFETKGSTFAMVDSFIIKTCRKFYLLFFRISEQSKTNENSVWIKVYCRRISTNITT